MQPLWQPDKQRISRAALTRFQSDCHDYEQLQRWSIEQRELFWSKVWDFAGIKGDKGAAPYLENPDAMPGSRWFPRASLNYAENLLRCRSNKIALVAMLENGQRQTISYQALYQRVAGLAAALRAEGVVKGDRIVGVMPNIIDTVVAMLATSSMGAIWSSCSPDFGAQGMLDRFGQIEPKIIFCSDGYFYNGKTCDTLAKVQQLKTALPSLQKIIVSRVVNLALELRPDILLIEDFIDHHCNHCHFEALPFDHPLFILYSSGTTGIPKCIVHGAGGTLIEHQKEHLLHTDISEHDVFFYYSTCGWMMWNWQVSALAIGCTLVLYDGAPTFPCVDSLLQLIDRENISVFGTSAKYISTLQKAACEPAKKFSLTSLKTMLSTGSPLSAESFQYVYRAIKPDVLLSSISGGTDIIGAFVAGNPCLPVYAGELQCMGLGFDLDIVNDGGESVRGQKGELICRRSFPSMPLYFWNDLTNEKFHSAYFERFPNLWAHGDYAEITEHDGFIIHGRSDALLNPGGVRIGTAEIYRQVEKVDAVVECVAVGQEWQGDCRVILFVVLKNAMRLDEQIISDIKSSIRTHTTPRHVPAKIIQVQAIPKTLSGKIVELAIREMIHGRPVKNKTALANPDSLLQFSQIAELNH
jgi:acetoacetyl-CoA synthetase